MVEMVQFLDPETTKILPSLDPEIVKKDKQILGSRNCSYGAISGSRNHRNCQQTLYEDFSLTPGKGGGHNLARICHIGPSCLQLQVTTDPGLVSVTGYNPPLLI